MSDGPPVGRDGVVLMQADRSEETAVWDKLGRETRAVLNESRHWGPGYTLELGDSRICTTFAEVLGSQ